MNRRPRDTQILPYLPYCLILNVSHIDNLGLCFFKPQHPLMDKFLHFVFALWNPDPLIQGVLHLYHLFNEMADPG